MCAVDLIFIWISNYVLSLLFSFIKHDLEMCKLWILHVSFIWLWFMRIASFLTKYNQCSYLKEKNTSWEFCGSGYFLCLWSKHIEIIYISARLSFECLFLLGLWTNSFQLLFLHFWVVDLEWIEHDNEKRLKTFFFTQTVFWNHSSFFVVKSNIILFNNDELWSFK